MPTRLARVRTLQSSTETSHHVPPQHPLQTFGTIPIMTRIRIDKVKFPQHFPILLSNHL